MNGPYKMNVLLIPAFILMPSPAHAAQVHKQHIPSIRRNRTNTGRHPAHAATRYRQARLLPSPPTAPPPSSILHGSSAAAKPAAPEPHPEEGTRTHRPTSPVPSVSCVAEPSLSTLSLSRPLLVAGRGAVARREPPPGELPPGPRHRVPPRPPPRLVLVVEAQVQPRAGSGRRTRAGLQLQAGVGDLVCLGRRGA